MCEIKVLIIDGILSVSQYIEWHSFCVVYTYIKVYTDSHADNPIFGLFPSLYGCKKSSKLNTGILIL